MLEKSNIFGNKFSSINQNNILSIFDCLNNELSNLNLHLELCVYGGGVMNLLYNNRPATQDIDCLFNINDLSVLNIVLSKVGKKFNLPDDWINQEVRGPLSYLLKQDLIPFKKYSNLSIKICTKEQLLAMKILSSRPEPSKDFVDAYLLCKDLNVVTIDDLKSIIKPFISFKLIGERQKVFIKYLGEDLGVDWEWQ